ncbi:MAG: hypothetical protein Q8Q14_07330 [Gemmatimonadales bacterium]|nr:hypothetical protein [Gemmatimonadales bacterium]
MSRRHPLPPTSFLSYWQEHATAHHCDDLTEAIQAGIYEVVVTAARGRRLSRRRWTKRRVLVVVPNHPDVWPRKERIRFCPFCGHRVHLLDAPAARLGPPPVVPDHLPEGM